MKKHDHVVVNKENQIVDCNSSTYLRQYYKEEIRLGNYLLMPYGEYEKKRLASEQRKS